MEKDLLDMTKEELKCMFWDVLHEKDKLVLMERELLQKLQKISATINGEKKEDSESE